MLHLQNPAQSSLAVTRVTLDLESSRLVESCILHIACADQSSLAATRVAARGRLRVLILRTAAKLMRPGRHVPLRMRCFATTKGKAGLSQLAYEVEVSERYMSAKRAADIILCPLLRPGTTTNGKCPPTVHCLKIY